MNDKHIRLETDRPIEDVVLMLNESIACNGLRAALQPRLAGTVTRERVVLRRDRPLFANNGYPVFRGTIRREDGRTVIEGTCTSTPRFLWVHRVIPGVIVVAGIWGATATRSFVFLLLCLLVAAGAAGVFYISQRFTTSMLMGDVELLVKDVREALHGG